MTQERLELIEAHIAIADLIHAYARAIRDDRPQDVPAMFTANGAFEICDGHPGEGARTRRNRVEGQAALRPYYDAAKGRQGPIPLIHNLMIAVEGDTATANCLMEGQVYGGEGAVLGEYDDRLRRVDGRWLFEERIYTIFSAASTI